MFIATYCFGCCWHCLWWRERFTPIRIILCKHIIQMKTNRCHINYDRSISVSNNTRIYEFLQSTLSNDHLVEPQLTVIIAAIIAPAKEMSAVMICDALRSKKSRILLTSLG